MPDYLILARQAYDQSTTFVDNNYRQQWEDNLNHFQSKHRAGSKYNKQSFQYRSKIFRPKTRAAIRNNEAAASAAFFTNQDVVHIEAQNPQSDEQKASADIMKELLQYRLTKTIPWFMTLIGAFQDGNVIGVICSYQTWLYEEKEVGTKVNGINPETGEEGEYTVKETVVVKDEPIVDLMPVEQLRIHPAASWIDPIGTSPYVIRMIPMYVQDVQSRMEKNDPKTGAPKWKEISEEEMRAAQRLNYDSTRQVRSGKREDQYEEQGKDKPLSAFDVVWVHENFIRIDGEDQVYFTLGTQHLLTDPKPIEEYYFTGERPFAFGIAVIESHKLYPDSPAQLGVPLQSELNENANQRSDNVKLVMNKRYTVKKGHGVDLRNLMRNVPGGATLVDEHDDIAERSFEDVTGSSYMEQDRLNLDFDELLGTFSNSSVQSNRKLNETVGGMAMLQNGVNSLVEYLIKTFAETWVEPVLRQLMKLEQKYETDMVILGIAADKANLFQKYGIDEVTDELLNHELTLTVNVGMGATDPTFKLQKFSMVVDKAIDLLANPVPGLNTDEVLKELFGRAGYKDGIRFIQNQDDGQDPIIAEMQAKIEELTQIANEQAAQLESDEADRQSKKEIELIKQDGANTRSEEDNRTELIIKDMEIENNEQRV